MTLFHDRDISANLTVAPVTERTTDRVVTIVLDEEAEGLSRGEVLALIEALQEAIE